MTDLSVFFKPINSKVLSDTVSTLGVQIDIHKEGVFPDIGGAKIAILGVKEDRNSRDNEGCSNGPDVIRKHLYRLFSFDEDIKLVDLGNIEAGDTANDTYFALKSSCAELIKNKTPKVLSKQRHAGTHE